MLFLLSYRVNEKKENKKVERNLQQLPQEKVCVLEGANPLNGLDRDDVKEFLQEKKRNYNSDDFLDACALFWSAKRTLKGKNLNIPLEPTIDSQGILMQMKI